MERFQQINQDYEDHIIKPEDLADIESQIRLNQFFESLNIKSTNEQFGAKDLLPVESFEEEKQLSLLRDKFLQKFSTEDILEAILETPFFVKECGVVEIMIPDGLINRFETLPDGYGYKGGVARSKLREVLRLPFIPPRDIDLIRLTQYQPQPDMDKILAEKYMSQDFEFGDGVEITTDAVYMSTRDFTINEVYVVGNKIVATEQCIRDTLRNIVRVTDAERENYQSGSRILGPKMKAKALRFHTEQLYTMGVSNIPEDDNNEIESSFINPFWLAVQLDRCFERGENVAESFTSLLKQYKIIPDDIKNALDLGDYLLGEVYDFKFRNAPKLQYIFEETEQPEELSDREVLEDYFDKIYHGSKY